MSYLIARLKQAEIEQQRVQIERLTQELESIRAYWYGEMEAAAQWKRERDEARGIAKSLYAWMGVGDALETKRTALRHCPWLEAGGDES